MAKKKTFSWIMGLVIFSTLIFLALSMGEQKNVAQAAAQCVNFGLRQCAPAEGGVLSHSALRRIYLCLTQS
ncbi:MAG: hypothetical protein KAR05_00295 [Candidatus Omnitrophica bacterium]|nr:hypothetical protein [Candidatus Omnitrophota bacterium]